MKLVFVVLALPLALCLGCGPGWVIEKAPIDDVRLDVAGTSAVTVYIKGGLPNSCYQFDNIKSTREGDTFTLTVTIKRPNDDRICAQIYGSFEKAVNLEPPLTPGKTYTLQVNDYTTSFSIPG